MNPELLKRLQGILAKDDSAIDDHDIRFMRARSSYLSVEQTKRLNKVIVFMGGVPMKFTNARQVSVVEVDEVVDQLKSEEAEAEEEAEGIEPGDDEEVDEDMPQDSGKLEIVDDAEEVDEDATNPDEEEVDVDEMNLEQLKVAAKELGIKGVHFYKEAEKLREKILATYQTSNESKEADQASEVI